MRLLVLVRMPREQNRYGTHVERALRYISTRCLSSRISTPSSGSSTTSRTNTPSRAPQPQTRSSLTVSRKIASSSLTSAARSKPSPHATTTSASSRTRSIWLGVAVNVARLAPRSHMASHKPHASHALTLRATMTTCRMSKSSCSMWHVLKERKSLWIAGLTRTRVMSSARPILVVKVMEMAMIVVEQLINQS